MRASPRATRGVAATIVACLGVASACYSSGNGSAPPRDGFNFPVGLAVSPGGNVLYVANSDFDLQYSGGTIQSYDLAALRGDAAENAARIRSRDPQLVGCSSRPPGQPDLGQMCAHWQPAAKYFRNSVVIGAFATDLQLVAFEEGGQNKARIFVPTRGDASVVWADVDSDVISAPGKPRQVSTPAPQGAFAIKCWKEYDQNRCDAAHHAGNDASQGTRGIAIPGEPFAMAFSADHAIFVLTHQNEQKASLFTTGIVPEQFVPVETIPMSVAPTLQFVAEGVVAGGNGLAEIPHDPDAPVACATPPCSLRPAFLMTTRAAPEVDRLRYFSDYGFFPATDAGADAATALTSERSTTYRPYLVRDGVFPITANLGGSDSRGIVIDSSPRDACKRTVRADADAKRISADEAASRIASCARRPARVFIANRTPASLVIGEVGQGASSSDGSYDPDQLALLGSIPIGAGPSRLFLAPVIVPDESGAPSYALRVFIACFDAGRIYVYDPDARQIENIIQVGQGPFAMAFDAIDPTRPTPSPSSSPTGTKDSEYNLPPYRFAYVASFTKSYVQVIDLSKSIRPGPEKPFVPNPTFENVVFTLGAPILPKGSN